MNKHFLLSLFLFLSGLNSISLGATCSNKLRDLSGAYLVKAIDEASPGVQKLAKKRGEALQRNLIDAIARRCGQDVDECAEADLRDAVQEALQITVATPSHWRTVFGYGNKYVLFAGGLWAYVSLMTSDSVSKELAVGLTMIFAEPISNTLSLVTEPLNAAGRALMVLKGSGFNIRRMGAAIQDHYKATYWRGQGQNNLAINGQYREQMLIPEFIVALGSASSLIRAHGNAALPRVADVLVTTAWDIYDHYPDVNATYLRFRRLAETHLGRYELNRSLPIWAEWIVERDKAVASFVHSHYTQEKPERQAEIIQDITRILDAWFPSPIEMH